MGLDAKGVINLRDIEDIPQTLIRKMKEKFPYGHYSIMVNLWDDYTYRVQLRHGEPIKDEKTIIYIWEYYEGEYNYKTEEHPAQRGTS